MRDPGVDYSPGSHNTLDAWADDDLARSSNAMQARNHQSRQRRGRPSVSHLFNPYRSESTDRIDVKSNNIDRVVHKQRLSWNWRHYRALTGTFLQLQFSTGSLMRSPVAATFFLYIFPATYITLQWLQLSGLLLSYSLASIPAFSGIIAVLLADPIVLGPTVLLCVNLWIYLQTLLFFSVYLILLSGARRAPRLLARATGTMAYFSMYPLYVPIQYSLWTAIIVPSAQTLPYAASSFVAMLFHLVLTWASAVNIHTTTEKALLSTRTHYLDLLSQACWLVIIATSVPPQPDLQQIFYFFRVAATIAANVSLHLLQPYQHTTNQVLSSLWFSLAWAAIGQVNHFDKSIPNDQLLQLHLFPFVAALIIGWLVLRKSNKLLEFPILLFRLFGRLHVLQDPVNIYLLLLEDALESDIKAAQFASFLNRQHNYVMANDVYNRMGVSEHHDSILQIEQALFWWKTDPGKPKWTQDNMQLEYAFQLIPNCSVVAVDKRIEEAKVLFLAWNRWLHTRGARVVHVSVLLPNTSTLPHYLMDLFPFSLSQILRSFIATERQLRLNDSQAASLISDATSELQNNHANIIRFILMPDRFEEPAIFESMQDDPSALCHALAEAVHMFLVQQIRSHHSHMSSLFGTEHGRPRIVPSDLHVLDDPVLHANWFPVAILIEMFHLCDDMSVRILNSVIMQTKQHPLMIIYHYDGINRRRSIALSEMAERMNSYPDVGPTVVAPEQPPRRHQQPLPLKGLSLLSTVRVETPSSLDVSYTGTMVTDTGNLDGTGVVTHSAHERTFLNGVDARATRARTTTAATASSSSTDSSASSSSSSTAKENNGDNGKHTSSGDGTTAMILNSAVRRLAMEAADPGTDEIVSRGKRANTVNGAVRSPSSGSPGTGARSPSSPAAPTTGPLESTPSVQSMSRVRSVSMTWNEVMQSPRLTRSSSTGGTRDVAGAESSKPELQCKFLSPTVTQGVGDICKYCWDSYKFLNHSTPETIPIRNFATYNEQACQKALNLCVLQRLREHQHCDSIKTMLSVAACLLNDTMTIDTKILERVYTAVSAGDDDAASSHQALVALCQEQLLVVSRNQLYTDVHVLFNSSAVRHAVYSNIPDSRRELLHKFCAAEYASMTQENYTTVIQRYLHTEQSNDAVACLPLVANFVEDLVHRSLYPIAISHGQLGLDLIDEILTQAVDLKDLYDIRAIKFTLCLQMAKSAGRISEFRLANRMINTAEDLMDGNRETAQVCMVKSELAMLEGFYDLAEETTRQGLERIWFARDRVSKCRLMRLLGAALHMEKQYDLSVFWFEDALRIARRLGAVQEEAKCLLGLSQVQADLGQLSTAYKNLDMSAQLFQFDSNQHWMAQAGMHYGKLKLLSGNVDEGRNELAKVLSLAADLNMHQLVGESGLLLLDLALLTCDYDLFERVMERVSRTINSIGHLQFELTLRRCRRRLQEHIQQRRLFDVENDLHLRTARSEAVRVPMRHKLAGAGVSGGVSGTASKMQQSFSIAPFNQLMTVRDMPDVVRMLSEAEEVLVNSLGDGNVLMQASLFLQSSLVSTVIGEMETMFRERADRSIDLCSALTAHLAMEMLNGDNGGTLGRRGMELRALCIYMRVVDDIPWDVYKGKTCCSGRQLVQWFQNAFLCSVETASSLALSLQGENLLLPVLKRSTFDRTKFKFYFMQDNTTKMFAPDVLNNLFEQMTARNSSLPHTKYKGERCFTGRHCVDWIISKWLDVEFASVSTTDMRMDLEDVESLAAGDSALRSAEYAIKQNERKALTSRKKAVQMAQQLLDSGYIKHMGEQEVFADSERSYYMSLKRRQKKYASSIAGTPQINRLLH